MRVRVNQNVPNNCLSIISYKFYVTFVKKSFFKVPEMITSRQNIKNNQLITNNLWIYTAKKLLSMLVKNQPIREETTS